MKRTLLIVALIANAYGTASASSTYTVKVNEFVRSANKLKAGTCTAGNEISESCYYANNLISATFSSSQAIIDFVLMRTVNGANEKVVIRKDVSLNRILSVNTYLSGTFLGDRLLMKREMFYTNDGKLLKMTQEKPNSKEIEGILTAKFIYYSNSSNISRKIITSDKGNTNEVYKYAYRGNNVGIAIHKWDSKVTTFSRTRDEFSVFERVINNFDTKVNTSWAKDYLNNCDNILISGSDVNQDLQFSVLERKYFDDFHISKDLLGNTNSNILHKTIFRNGSKKLATIYYDWVKEPNDYDIMEKRLKQVLMLIPGSDSYTYNTEMSQKSKNKVNKILKLMKFKQL